MNSFQPSTGIKESEAQLKEQLLKVQKEIENQIELNKLTEMQIAKKKEAQKDKFNGLSDKERDDLVLMDGQINNKRQQLVIEATQTQELEGKAVELKQNTLLMEMLQYKIKCDQALKEYNEI